MESVEKFISQLNQRYREGGKAGPAWRNELTYDSSIETLEPVYYWILDFKKGAMKVMKLADNFTAAPGSSYFADLSARATRMQEEGMKILGAVNLVVKGIINILYDLKEFEIRLKLYEKALKGKTKEEKDEGILALKDVWMSNVDIKRGRGSVNQMTYELGFTTLRDAFMKAESPDDVDKMGREGLLNERVVRILKPRIAEFIEWKQRSHDELERRFRIEQAYLKSQVDTLKLYSSWVKPYIQAAEQLRMRMEGMSSPELISAFGSMLLNLSLMLYNEVDVADEANNKNLPMSFKKKKMRKMYKIVFIDYTFRSYPTQQFPHAGRVDIIFSSYALNEDEYDLMIDKIEKEQTSSLIGVAGNLSEESLKQLQDEIDYFTKKPEKKEEKKEESMFSGIVKDFMKSIAPKGKEDLIREYSEVYEKSKGKEPGENEIAKIRELPVQAIKDEIKSMKSKGELKKRLDELKEKGVPPDNYEESIVRNLAELDASTSCFDVYDKFKKSRGMAAPPNPFDEPDVYQRLRERRAEIQAAMNR